MQAVVHPPFPITVGTRSHHENIAYAHSVTHPTATSVVILYLLEVLCG